MFMKDIVKRPIIRYHGGKWKLSSWIISNFPAHRVYVEPFGGAGSVLLKKPRSSAEIYNDLDSEMVNLFHVARDRGYDLKLALEMTPFSRAEFDLSWEYADDPLERARRTVVRSAMGRDSASATRSRKSSFRVYVGRKRTATMQDWVNYPDTLNHIISRLRGVAIENRDASKVILSYDKEDVLHYIDPPYVSCMRDKSGNDYRFEMDDNEHEQLLSVLLRLKGMIVISGYECDLYSDYLTNWRKVTRKTFADGAKERTEVLWLSPSAIEASLRKAS